MDANHESRDLDRTKIQKKEKLDVPSNSLFLFRQLYSILISTMLYDRGGLIDCGGDHA